MIFVHYADPPTMPVPPQDRTKDLQEMAEDLHPCHIGPECILHGPVDAPKCRYAGCNRYVHNACF